jgi:hypothetical protein
VIPSSAQSLIAVFGIGLGSVAIGGLLLRDGVLSLNEVIERGRGPSVMGRVITSRQTTRDVPADDGSYSRTWQVEIVYEYRVRGRPYRASQTMAFTSYLAAVRHAGSYETGVEVRVYVDPREPDSAVLDPRRTVWQPWFYIVAGASCVIVGVVALTRLAAAS